MEEWKDIKDYEGLYQVSNEGRVKSIDRFVETFTGIRHYKEKIIIPNLKKDNYYEVSLYYKGKREHRRLNRLVADAFIPNPENKSVVGHYDCKRTNNKVENLYWCTQEENNKHPLTNERQKNNPKKSKQVYQYSLNGELIAIWPSAKEVERKTEFKSNKISKCCNGKNKTHKGYKWSFEPL